MIIERPIWYGICYDDTMTRDFQPPTQLPEVSDIAHIALQLASLSERLALEERTLVNHPTGRPENVAEHSAMLALIAPAIAEQYYPHLDANLVCRFAALHDAVEAYAGDTTTHVISEQGLQEKAARERAGLAQLQQDFAAVPQVISLLETYEAQVVPEARFVRIVDKWTPILMHFADHGKTLRAYTNTQELLENFAARAIRLKEQYPDFTELVTVREELTALAAKHFL